MESNHHLLHKLIINILYTLNWFTKCCLEIEEEKTIKSEMELFLFLVTTGRVASATSAYLQWMVVQNCSSSQVKRNKQMYSAKHSNLKALNSFCYNRLIHKTVWGESTGLQWLWNADLVSKNQPLLTWGPPSTRTYRLGYPQQHRVREPREEGPPRFVRSHCSQPVPTLRSLKPVVVKKKETCATKCSWETIKSLLIFFSTTMKKKENQRWKLGRGRGKE